MEDQHPPDLEDLMHEKTVYEKYNHLLADRELLHARKNGLIKWYDLRKGPHYTAADVMEYFKQKVICPTKEIVPMFDKQSGYSSTNNTGSVSNQPQTTTNVIGMKNPQQSREERVAEALDAET